MVMRDAVIKRKRAAVGMQGHDIGFRVPKIIKCLLNASHCSCLVVRSSLGTTTVGAPMHLLARGQKCSNTAEILQKSI